MSPKHVALWLQSKMEILPALVSPTHHHRIQLAYGPSMEDEVELLKHGLAIVLE